jgi:hypothetical protein
MGSLVINLDGDGSPAPGAGGGNALIPKGVEGGNPDPASALAELEREIKRQKNDAARQRREEERRLAEEAKKKPPAPEPPKPDTKPEAKPTPPKPDSTAKPDPSAKPPAKPQMVSLDSILKDRARAAQNNTGNTRPKPDNTGSRPNRTGKAVGVDVGQIIGSVGGGAGPLGVSSGTGLGGSPRGGGKVLADYESRMKMLVQDQWQQLLDKEGKSILEMEGEFRLNISRNGSLSFGGWVNSPGNALFESLLRRAIDAVGRSAGTPPPGTPAMLVLGIRAASH